MERRSLYITIKRANHLKNVNLFSTMDVYAVVSILGDPLGISKQKTHVAKDGGINPQWNHSMNLSIDENAAQGNLLTLKIKLFSDRIFFDTKIGEVQIPIKELLDESRKGDNDEDSEKSVTYSVRTARGKKKGTLEFSFKFGEIFRVQAPPPPPPVNQAQAQAQPRRHARVPDSVGGSSSGSNPLGYLGLGGAVGLMGSLLVAEMMISNACDTSSFDAGYDAGYDAGFSGGFDC